MAYVRPSMWTARRASCSRRLPSTQCRVDGAMVHIVNSSQFSLKPPWRPRFVVEKNAAARHLSINFTQSSAIGVARENGPDCVPAKSAWVLTGGSDRYSARTAMGSERPHTGWLRFTAAVGRGADKARDLRFRRTPTITPTSSDLRLSGFRRRKPTTVRGLSGP
jgi:hypothetical protein